MGLVSAGVVVSAAGAASAASQYGQLVISKDGTVLDGRTLNGGISIRANNVRISNSTVRSGGGSAIRIAEGFSGTVIEKVKIYCGAPGTDGVVPGDYAARLVKVFGCRRAFVFSNSAPATIVDSTWNGKAVPERSDLGPAAGAAAAGVAGASTRTGAGLRAAYPGAGTTGVPVGVALKASGSITVKTDGQVIQGLRINGCVTVYAKNVTIRNSAITCGSYYSIRTMPSARNLVVRDVEINGMARNAAAVCCDNYSLTRVDISNVLDGPRLGNNTLVENSWIHHMTRVAGSHNDTLQTTGASNIVVRGNSLEAYNPVTRDPFNACLMIGSTVRPIVANMIVEDNYCNGGNYSIGIRVDLNASGVRFSDNAFGRDYRFGIVASPHRAGITWDDPSNVWADTLKPIVG